MDKFRAILPKSPWTWLVFWAIWLITLWFLSEGHPTPENGPEIPHLDKILHFGYFMGGAILVSGHMRLNGILSPTRILILVTIIGATIGALDEYHQTFTPGRSGNDPYDWLADLLGTITGSLITLKLLFPTINKAHLAKK